MYNNHTAYKRSFSLAEMMLAFLITAILITSTMPLITRNKSKGDDTDSIACIKNDLVKNGGLDISSTACTANSNSPCCKAIEKCRYKMGDSCKTLEYYADYGKTQEKNNARKILRQACDQEGEEACKYFAFSCKRDSSVCDIAGSDYDLHYYLTLPVTDNNNGRIIIEDILKTYYDAGYEYIKSEIDDSCCNPNLNTACKVKGQTGCALARFYGDSGTGSHIELDNAGNVYISFSQKDSDIGLTLGKLDINGNIIWKYTYNPSYNKGGGAEALAFNQDKSNLYVTGYVNSGTNDDITVLKLNLDGNLIWGKTYKKNINDYSADIAVDNSGNIIISAHTLPTDYNGDAEFLKLDTDGNIIWQKKLNDPMYVSGDFAHNIVIDNSNNIFAGVESYEDIWKYVIVKFDTNGNIVWSKSTNDNGRLRAFVRDTPGNFYLAGERLGSFGVAKMDPNGNVVWYKRIIPSSNDVGDNIIESIRLDGSGNIYTSGYSRANCGAGTSQDSALLKLDASGNIIWDKRFGTCEYEWDWETVNDLLLYDNDKSILFTGAYYSNGGADPTYARISSNQSKSSIFTVVDDLDYSTNIINYSVSSPGFTKDNPTFTTVVPSYTPYELTGLGFN